MNAVLQVSMMKLHVIQMMAVEMIHALMLLTQVGQAMVTVIVLTTQMVVGMAVTVVSLLV